MKKALRKTLKVLAWTTGSIILLLLLLLVLIQIPGVQNFAKDKAVAYLQKKLHTKVEVRRLSIKFPKTVVLEGIYVEDLQKDTLLAGERVFVDLAMFKLLKSEIVLKDVELEGIRAKIYRREQDSFFNYQFVLDAFAPADSTPTDTTAKPMKVDINHIALRRITGSFFDAESGSDMYAYIGDFETNIDEFDLQNMRFDIPDIRLKSVVARLYQHKPLVEPKSDAEVVANNAEPMNLGLKLGKVDVGDIDVDFANDVSKFSANAQLGSLLVRTDSINLATLDIALKEFELRNTAAVIHMGKSAASKEVEEQVETTAQVQAAKPWKFVVASTVLDAVSLKFDNDNSPRVPRGIDYAHLDVDTLHLYANDLTLTPTVYEGVVTKGSLYEANTKFSLHQLQTAFRYSDTGVVLRKLYLETDKTILKDDVAVTWPSLDALARNPGTMGLAANINDSRIALSDVLLFAPMLSTAPPFYRNEGAIFNLSLRMDGRLSDLKIYNVEASGMQGTRLAASGRITGLPDPVRTIYNLNLRNVQTVATDLPRLLPPGIIPNTVRVPEMIRLTGAFVGSAQNQHVDLNVYTSRGGAVVQGDLRNTASSYDLTASAANLDLGYILKDEKTFGRVTATAVLKGSGFDPKTMNTTVQARVVSAGFSGYNYSGINVNAKIQRGAYSGHISSTDPNAHLAGDFSGSMRGDYPSIKTDMMVDSLNLQKLGFYAGDFRFHGRLIADMPSTNPDALEGSAQISNVLMSVNGQRFATDTISLLAGASDSGRFVRVISEAVVADLYGQYKLTELGPAVMAVINKYYELPGYRPGNITTPQRWTANVKVIPSNLLYAFVPEMKGSDTVFAKATFNSEAQDLSLLANARRIVFGTNSIDSLTARANTAQALDYSVTLEGAGNESFRLYRTELAGNVANNQLLANLNTDDANGADKYKLGATLNALENDGYRISLLPELMLDYENWTVGNNNYIEYQPAGLVVNNFSISNDGQSLSAASTTLSPTAPIQVQFSNFRIKTLTNIAEQDSLFVDGLINGNATVLNPAKNATFNSNLTINDLSYQRDTIGNVAIKVDNETQDVLNANVTVEGNGNDIRLTGTYGIPTEKIDMQLNIANLNLKTIKPFTAGQVDSADGSLVGNIAIGGTGKAPALDGSIRFQDARIKPTLLGETFAINENPIRINGQGIHLDRLTLADSASNTAVLDGDVLTTNFVDYRFDLTFKAEDFRAVNSTRGGSEQPFYGKLNLTTNLNIGGNINMPSVNGKLRINDNTDFAYILPSENPEVQNREGVVRFVDMDSPQDTSIFRQSVDTVKRIAAGIDLDVQIETDSNANFKLVIDERNGDALNLRGTANLNAGMDQSGKISLTGTYVLQEGSYLLTLNFLKRQFSIQPGSYLTWTGDPTSAIVDITAVYLANTASLDLVEHQLSGRSASEINRYKQKLPFNVLLRMQGDLMKPIITFDVTLPSNVASQWPEVQSKLEQIRTDESELNKQVFAVLLLGHFVDQNPLESAAGGGNLAETYIRQSASRILTDQLNRLAGQLIKGVDVNFGITSGADYSTGTAQQRTDLNVGLSKRLLNDRLRVNVGSSFELEGQNTNNTNASDIAGDVSIDYMLTADGRYQLSAYRRNNYEALAVGQVVETGATVSFQMDYDRLSEWFKRKPKKKDKDTTGSK